MDFQEDNNLSGPRQPEPIPGLTADESIKQTKKFSGWRILFGIIFGSSVIANFMLFFLLIAAFMAFASSQSGSIIEEVVREGPSGTKIAMVSVQGVIYDEQAESVYKQLQAAGKDRRVKAVIVHVNSPGGTISASDQIYQEILKFRKKTNKPVIAFMQGVAASGGYYTSVACETIIAEPTTITGSIGVISSYLVVEELLENKLGITPITIKSGDKKDWPSSFRSPTEEEIQYIQDKLIKPALERFVNIVAEGRKKSLTLSDVKRLADGSIYGAQEALDEKLIDKIGYLDEAVDLAKSQAGIDKARVVRYRKPFSFSDFLSYRAENTLKLNRNTLYELGTPEILYLWNAH
ncbi:MAG: signal peptide peptidase SppA [Sedimentisphaerales bacterium]|nr:signal peptide peptidase SppA [Sedimentisphaerales bacterium]